MSSYGFIDQIWVKDESKRFGLNAFKVLGSSYAIAKKANQRRRKRESKMEEVAEEEEKEDCSWNEVRHIPKCPSG